jgi:hypothetical protein
MTSFANAPARLPEACSASNASTSLSKDMLCFNPGLASLATNLSASSINKADAVLRAAPRSLCAKLFLFLFTLSRSSTANSRIIFRSPAASLPIPKHGDAACVLLSKSMSHVDRSIDRCVCVGVHARDEALLDEHVCCCKASFHAGGVAIRRVG